jgi:NADH dehydrogenase
MIVITGASGYVGSHITRKLVEQGHPVRALVHNKQRAEKEQRLRGMNLDWVEGDVTNPGSLKNAFSGASTIIHTVAIAIEKGGGTYETINYQGTVNVVNAAKEAGIERFVNLSQLGADASLPYRFLASKGKAQDYVAASGLNWTAFRPSVIWGPEDEFANSFAKLVPFSPIIFPIVGDQNSKFQSIWVEDVATCIVKSIDMPETIGKEYEIGGPEVLTLEEIERRTLLAIGARRKMIHFPMGLLRFVVSVMESLLPNPPVTRSLLDLLQVSNVTSKNSINLFVKEPRPFTAQNAAVYMREFHWRETLAQFRGK